MYPIRRLIGYRINSYELISISSIIDTFLLDCKLNISMRKIKNNNIIMKLINVVVEIDCLMFNYV